jgi:hypothetical protein
MLHLGTQAARQEKSWLTPRANEPDSDSNFVARNADRGDHCHPSLSQQVKSLWPTPTALNRVRDEETMEKCLKFRQGNGQTSVPLYLEERVNLEEKSWRTPSSSDGEGGIMQMREGCAGKYKLRDHVAAEEVKSWATPIMGDSHLASTPEVAQKRIEEGKVTLSRQNPGKLNPRWVETLMGLPVGWVMPSCASPVTIEPTNCASSATESCQQQPRELLEF